MSKTRSLAAIAFATTLTGSTLALTMAPMAHADSLAPIRQAVIDARAGSTCPPLNYSVPLEGEAQHAVGNTLPGVPPTGQYQGTFDVAGHSAPFGSANNVPDGTRLAVSQAGGAINDCSYKDFGVGFVRTDGEDQVAIVLGKPAAPAAPVPQPQPQPANTNLPVSCAGGGGYKLPPGSDCSKTPNPSPPPAPAPQPVVNAITASFAKPGLTSIQLKVTNSSALTAACHYDAEAQTNNPLVPSQTLRDFQVEPHTTAANPHLETFDGAPTLTNYQVTITCTDASGQQKDPIGTVQLSQTW